MILRLPSRFSAAAGFTLFEALVVLIITGLIAAVLVQSMGTVLAGRNAVVNKIVGLENVVIERNLILEPLRGVVPDQQRVDTLTFSGTEKSLTGITIRPLQRAVGAPTRFRMFLEYDTRAGVTALMYQEGGDDPMELARWPGDRSAFFYSDSDGRWLPAWPPATRTAPVTPWLIRIDTGLDFPPSPVAVVAGTHDVMMRLEDMLGGVSPR